MNSPGNTTRRDFLAAGMALPAVFESGGLRYRTLGRTGLKVTTLGMGCVPITDPSVVTRAADLGINHFDTACDYQGSNSERTIGRALKGRRKPVIIGTKTGAEAAAQKGLGVVAIKVMAGGYRPGGGQQRQGVMPAALKWVLRNQNVHSTAVSMADTEQPEENLRAVAEPFTKQDRRLLAGQLERITPFYCRMCGRCENVCPRGLPIEDMLRWLTYADGDGQFGLGREKFRMLPAAVGKVCCGDCTRCPVECPVGFQISARRSRAQEIFA
jgi:predicted aldo/keto reductase-like oxidoreductase